MEIALAPEGSPKVALAEESIKQAETQKAEARSAFLPDLESSLSDRRETANLRAFGFSFNIPPGLGFSIPTIVGPFSVFDARATASQTVFDFSTIRKYQASKVNVEAAKSDFDATKNQVSDQVARAYATDVARGRGARNGSRQCGAVAGAAESGETAERGREPARESRRVARMCSLPMTGRGWWWRKTIGGARA